MFLNGSDISCGVGQLSGLFSGMYPETAEHIADAAIRTRGRSTRAFILFSDAEHLGRGELLAKELRRRGYTVVESNEKKNPNSGSMIKVWIWDTTKKRTKKEPSPRTAAAARRVRK